MGKKNCLRIGDEEAERRVAEIRKLYDDYIVSYFKPPSIRYGFEERYLAALKAKIDLTAFFLAEKDVIKEFINREKRKKAADFYASVRNSRKVPGKAGGEKDFADRIIEENRKKIEPYPDLYTNTGIAGANTPSIDSNRGVVLSFPDFAFEISKLYGALCDLCRQHWPDVERFLRKIYPSLYSGPRMILESRIQSLCTTNMEGYPPALSRYAVLLGRIPRNIKEIDREVQRCILDASFFLHDFRKELQGILTDGDILAEDGEIIDNAISYASRIIEDFRLQDLKRQ